MKKKAAAAVRANDRIDAIALVGAMRIPFRVLVVMPDRLRLAGPGEGKDVRTARPDAEYPGRRRVLKEFAGRRARPDSRRATCRRRLLPR
jgi:hypothetical protein